MDHTLRQWVEQTLSERAASAPRAADWQPLRVEASHRRFYRVSWGAGPARASVVVMSSPPELENNTQFLALAVLFHQHGIGVPEVIAEDPDRGYFLLSDLGDSHFEDVYARRGPGAVMPAALDTLHRLQRIDDARIPPYTRQRFADELGIYVTWCLGALLDVTPETGLEDAFGILLEATQAQPVCCVHRDFHCRNLLEIEDGVGVVDFQDALVGPATYDLASLLRDCYYRFSEPAVARWRDAWLETTPLPVNRERFARDLDFTALQRQLKALGIFARLWLRDGRDTHLATIVPVLGRIGELAGRYAETRALAAHAATLLPKVRRRLGGSP